MAKERFKDFIQRENPEMYKEVQEEVQQEYKKRGGVRAGAGRPAKEESRIVVHTRLSEETVSLIVTYKKEHNLKTKTDAIEELIKAGYNHNKKCPA